MSDESDETEEIMRLVGDLAAAQHAVNGRVDRFELKKAVLRRIRNIELRDDLAPNMLPKKLNKTLDTIIATSLFRMQFDNYRAQNPDESLKPIRPLRFMLLLLKYNLLCKLRRFADAESDNG
jgi:hypothetical protein